jgi:hypothetical protein
MKPEEIKRRLHSGLKSRLREDLITQGFFDGRFRSKTVKDKRKEDSRTFARKPIRIEDL